MEQIRLFRRWKDKAWLEGRREGKSAALRANLLKLLRTRFPGELPQDVTRAIEPATDLKRLSRWFNVALSAPSLAAFGTALQAPSSTHDVAQIEMVEGWKKQARREGHNEGLVEANRANLLKLLRAKFPGELAPDVTQTIQQTTDLAVLSGWFDAALTAGSLEGFRAALQMPAAPAPTT